MTASTTARAEAATCAQGFAKVSVASRIASVLKNSILVPVRYNARVTFYPVVGPIRLVRESVGIARNEGVREIWRAPFRIAKKDGSVIVGAATVAVFGGRLSIRQVDFNEETKEFRSELGKQTYVYVDMVPDDDHLSRVPKFDYDQLEKSEKTHYLKAKNYEDLVEKLNAFKAKHGQVYGLSIYAHGSTGYVEGMSTGDLERGPEIQDVLKPNGKVLLNSCFVGNGSKGKLFVESLGQKFLPAGGTIYSSTVPIASNASVELLSRKGMSAGTAQRVSKLWDTFVADPDPAVLAGDLYLNYLAADDKDIMRKRVRVTTIPPADLGVRPASIEPLREIRIPPSKGDDFVLEK